MMAINDVRFMYHWTKEEKAMKKGDNIKAKKHKDKFNRLLLLKIRKG